MKIILFWHVRQRKLPIKNFLNGVPGNCSTLSQPSSLIARSWKPWQFCWLHYLLLFQLIPPLVVKVFSCEFFFVFWCLTSMYPNQDLDKRITGCPRNKIILSEDSPWCFLFSKAGSSINQSCIFLKMIRFDNLPEQLERLFCWTSYTSLFQETEPRLRHFISLD